MEFWAIVLPHITVTLQPFVGLLDNIKPQSKRCCAANEKRMRCFEVIIANMPSGKIDKLHFYSLVTPKSDSNF